MEQTRALNALEPFLALSKSATSARAAADLITQATSAPQTFVFAELLQTPNVQALAQSKDYAGHLKLLEVFSWGTWQDYVDGQSHLPTLNEHQTQKLRLLTLLTVLADQAPSSTTTTAASSSPNQTTTTTLTYAHLQHALALPSPRSLEDLLISAIYASLLTAALSPATQTVDVAAVAPLRDLRPGALPQLAARLDAWAARCGDALAMLEREMQGVKMRARREAERKRVGEQGFERALEALDREKKAQGLGWGTAAGGLRGGGEGVKRSAGEGDEDEAAAVGDVMDVDGEGGVGGGGGGGGGRKRGGGGGGPFAGAGRRLG
ncbi:MAG: hypothetical protein M1821_001325 [Bathelium mastoideum]|nr:MAG: hypothetical protein M1821_001325 [Bathelium mastoideum]KAI9689850.1 MAG: hypothetical protein M1822_009732 [Bathelium mastoideum]